MKETAMAKAKSLKFADTVRDAPFIFDGTVEKPNAATMPAIASEATAIVKVNEVFRAPPAVGNLKGKKITLQLASVKGTKAGQRATFYATSWMYGDSLALAEVSRETPSRSKSAVSDMRGLVANAELELENLALQRRVEQANFVVTGWVTEIGPVQTEAPKGPISEHAPDWWWADIHVEHAGKGALRTPTLRVLYPNSTDELWIDAPKFHVGQHGVWLLRKDQKEKGPPAMRVAGLTALHPLDFQQPTNLNRIRALVKRSAK
jgi:hypothetical protein